MITRLFFILLSNKKIYEKYTILISCLFIFGCGIKKDLATANESNTTLTEKVKELELKNQELADENQKLRGRASS